MLEKFEKIISDGVEWTFEREWVVDQAEHEHEKSTTTEENERIYLTALLAKVWICGAVLFEEFKGAVVMQRFNGLDDPELVERLEVLRTAAEKGELKCVSYHLWTADPSKITEKDKAILKWHEEHPGIYDNVDHG